MDHYQHHTGGATHLTRQTQTKRREEQELELLTICLTTNSQSEPVNQATFKTSHSRPIDASWECSQVDPVALNELKILLSRWSYHIRNFIKLIIKTDVCWDFFFKTTKPFPGFAIILD